MDFAQESGCDIVVDHLRDYAAEVVHAQRAEERQLKRLRKRGSKEILVDGILDGSYARYLKGE